MNGESTNAVGTDRTDPTDRYRLTEEDRRRAGGHSVRAVAFDRASSLCYPIYRAVFEEDSPTVRTLRRRLERAAIPMTVEDYVSGWMAAGVVVGVVLAAVGAVVGGVVVEASVLSLGLFPHQPLLAMTSGVTAAAVSGGVLGLGVATVVGLYYPKARAARRRREIDRNLTDAVTFMYSLSAGGIGLVDVVGEVARSEDTYGELSVEFQRLFGEIRIFKINARDALQDVADRSPSRELRDLFYELATNLSSGGDATEFLDHKRQTLVRSYERTRQEELERLDLFNEMYVALTVLPLGAIVVSIGVAFQQPAAVRIVPVVVYAGMPAIGLAFLVAASSATRDMRSHASIDTDADHAGGLLSAPIIDDQIISGTHARGDLELMRRHAIRSRLTSDLIGTVRAYPPYTLLATGPVAVGLAVAFAATGVVSYSVEGLKGSPEWTTVVGVVLPAFVVLVPLAVLYEREAGRRRQIVDPLTPTLFKLKQANEAGNPLLKAIEITGDKGDSLLTDELREIPLQVRYGSDLESELVSFANEYGEPRLVRTVRLINRAREASSNVSEVLDTAAELSDIEDRMRKKRKSHTATQVAVVILAFLTLSAVVLTLKVSFLGKATMVGSTAGDTALFSGFDAEFVNAMFLHAILVQATIAGSIAGYMRTGRLQEGIKYVVALVAVGLLAWHLVAVIV